MNAHQNAVLNFMHGTNYLAAHDHSIHHLYLGCFPDVDVWCQVDEFVGANFCGGGREGGFRTEQKKYYISAWNRTDSSCLYHMT